MTGECSIGDWEDSSILCRAVSCLFYGALLGTFIFIPLIGIIGGINPTFALQLVNYFGNGDKGEFFAFYMLMYSLFSGLCLFVLQRGWK